MPTKRSNTNEENIEDGFYTPQPEASGLTGPKKTPKTIVKIPRAVIKYSVALTIFTNIRCGGLGLSS